MSKNTQNTVPIYYMIWTTDFLGRYLQFANLQYNFASSWVEVGALFRSGPFPQNWKDSFFMDVSGCC